jgi:spermidine synthase
VTLNATGESITVVTVTSKSRHESAAIHLLVFLSGFTFLVYEVSWNRMLSLVLGTTVTASTIVLASFMAGFGTGANFWGKTANNRSDIGRLLTVLMLGIGVLGGVNYVLFTTTVQSIYSSLGSAGLSGEHADVIMFVLAFVAVFIPSFLMGGILPAAGKVTVKSDSAIASSVGGLYAADTLGSTFGGLLCGFVLLGGMGQRNTVVLASLLNLLMAAVIFMSRAFRNEGSPELPQSPSESAHRSVSSDGLMNDRRIALIGSFACGFAILSLQVFWIRILRTYFTNTSYTFALVSSIAILGLFIGSLMFHKRGHRITNHRNSMFRAIVFIGVAAAAGLVLLIFLPQLLMFPFQSALSNPMVRVLVLPFVTSMLVILPPTLISGYAFPLACRMYAAGASNISHDIGIVLTANTAGCVIGPVVAAFVLLPHLGAALSVLGIVWTLAVTAIVLLRYVSDRKSIRKVRTILSAIALLLLIVIVAGREIRIVPPSFIRFDRDVLFYSESVEGTLTVGQDRNSDDGSKYTYVNNSAVIGSTYDAVKVVKMVGHFPFFLGLDCRNVLVIGFGIGVTTSAIASHDEVESIECVELVGGLRDAAVFYSELNNDVIEDPRLDFITGDGRHYMQSTNKSYDLISCDPTHPILGSSNLYTGEYFELCREHLTPKGMVSQYLPLHKLRTQDFLGIICTFQSVFPNCTVWLGHFHAVLLGSMEPISVDLEQWNQRVASIGSDAYLYVDY